MPSRFTTQSSSLWRSPDFLRLWAAQSVSELGSQVTSLALPLLAVLTLSASTFEVGAVEAALFAPFLLISLPAGVWIDRVPSKRMVMLWCDVGRALLLLTLPLAYWLEVLSLLLLLGVAALLGVLTVLFDVAYQAYLPSLVPRASLGEGNSKLTATRSISEAAGPGLAGLLIGAIGAARAVLADAGTYAVSAVALLAIQTGDRGATRTNGEVDAVHATGSGSRYNVLVEVREGLVYVLRHPLLSRTAGCTGTWNLASAAAGAVYIVFFVRELGFGPGTIGLVFGVGNAGAVLGSVVATRLSRRFGLGPTIVCSAVLGPLMVLFIPLANGGYAVPLLICAWLPMAAAVVIYNIGTVTLRQSITPDHLLGRMTASMRFIVWGTLPIGSLGGGALAVWMGARPALWVFAGVGLLAPLCVLWSPVRSLRDVAQPAG